MIIISNTQITAHNLCERQHYYRFVRNLEPRTFSAPITTGLLGHSALEAYYSELKEGSSVDTCKKAALGVLDKEIKRIAVECPEEFDQVQRIVQLKRLIEGYAEVYRQEPFRVLEVEKVYKSPILPGIDYGMKLDLLVEFISGQYRGDLAVVDHKFVYNFKTQLDIEMDCQLPKYIKTLRDNGLIITKGLFNQIRTRQIRDPKIHDLYRRSWLRSSNAEINQIWNEQEYVANKINSMSTVPVDQAGDYAPRTLSQIVCRSCFFQPLCKAELNGDNVDQMVKANYQQSSYGYEEMDSED